MRHIKRLRDRRDYRARRVLQEWAVMPQRVQVGWRDPLPRTKADVEAALKAAPVFVPDPGSMEISRIPLAAEGARWRPRAGVRSAE